MKSGYGFFLAPSLDLTNLLILQFHALQYEAVYWHSSINPPPLAYFSCVFLRLTIDVQYSVPATRRQELDYG
jgi:hypothetical protein